jgi:transcription initiation factor IIF auxiliary subunit
MHSTNALPPSDDPAEVDGIPMRGWNIQIFLVSADGDELPATCYEKATYVLHESFGPKRMRQQFRRPPFRIDEKGWGEFDMQIVLTPIGIGKSGEHTLAHDLNFQQERYESTHNVTFRNPKGALLDALRESGDVGDAAAAPKSNGVTSTPATGQAKEKKARKSQNRNVDMEKLAEALPQLGEEDLLQVVQMVHDNKTDDTYTKNDVDSELFKRLPSTLRANILILFFFSQTANSTSTSTPFPISSSRCFGTSPLTESTWPSWHRISAC